MAKAVDILNDGTLIVNTRHYDKVKRVLVQHGTKGTLYYPDGTLDVIKELIDKWWTLPETSYSILKKIKECIE